MSFPAHRKEASSFKQTASLTLQYPSKVTEASKIQRKVSRQHFQKKFKDHKMF